MQRRFRLTRSSDFQRVRRYGKSYAHPLIVLAACQSDSSSCRIGIVAGKSVGNAVERNRAKRRLRALMQPYLSALPLGWDVVLIARKPMLLAGFSDLEQAIAGLLRRSRLLTLSNREQNGA